MPLIDHLAAFAAQLTASQTCNCDPYEHRGQTIHTSDCPSQSARFEGYDAEGLAIYSNVVLS
jgi:hypothetical protein